MTPNGELPAEPTQGSDETTLLDDVPPRTTQVKNPAAQSEVWSDSSTLGRSGKLHTRSAWDERAGYPGSEAAKPKADYSIGRST
jgi:hypothetical protein